MKSIRPGRGHSKDTIAGSVIMTLFGVFWCIVAAKIGGGFMVPFGLLFIGLAVYNGVRGFHNISSDEPDSFIDIVDTNEEHRNVDRGLTSEGSTSAGAKGNSVDFCPYCGKAVEGDFDFCPKCGRKLPD